MGKRKRTLDDARRKRKPGEVCGDVSRKNKRTDEGYLRIRKLGRLGRDPGTFPVACYPRPKAAFRHW